MDTSGNANCTLNLPPYGQVTGSFKKSSATPLQYADSYTDDSRGSFTTRPAGTIPRQGSSSARTRWWFKRCSRMRMARTTRPT
jgi:hypothetical protein